MGKPARRMAAVLVDTMAAAILVFIGFRVGLAIAPCAGESDCVWLTPIIVLLIVAGVLIYFASSRYFWHRTPGQRLFRVE